MIKIYESVSQTGKTKSVINIIGSTPFGDYLLLKEEYKKLDSTYFKDKPHWKILLSAQSEFMRKTHKHNPNLVCVYCGKENLKRQGKKNELATVDHFFPKSLDGVDPINQNNFVVACSKCNGEKSNLIYSLDSLKYITHYKNHEQIIKNLIEIKLQLNLDN